MKNFIRSILLENFFKESYIESLISDPSFINQDDERFYKINKGRLIWKTRIFSKLKFKSFTKQSKNYWLFRGYSKIEARDLSNENKLSRKDPTPMQKEFWMKKGMSEDDAIFKIRSSRKLNIEYWTSRGYSIDEAKNKIKDYQKINSDKLKDKKNKDPELFEDVSWNQKKYWMKKGMSEDDAEKKVSELQKTFSLEICIKKYGEEIGREKWLDRQEKWNKNYKKTNYSKISQDLFQSIIKKYNMYGKKIFFATYDNGKINEDGINREYTIRCENISIKPDFLLLDEKKIIEFDGTYWHNHKKRNRPENQKRELIRHNELIKMGYRVLRIMENEYMECPDKIVDKCIDFLKN